MAKVSGSYKSLVRGVSEQVPEERLPGQHGEQINTLSDPVRGLVRRQGTVMVHETVVQHTTQADLGSSYRSEDVKIEDRELTLLLRRPTASPAQGGGHGHAHGGHGTHTAGPALWVVQRGTYPGAADGQLLDVRITDAAITKLDKGVTAHAVVGRFLLLGHSYPVSEGATVNNVGSADNLKRGAVQVRGGAYSRTFTVRYKLVGAPEQGVSYTTPAASYGGTLDTSGVAASDPEYQKKVNDLINAYNSEVTKWLGTAAAAIQPAAIADQLRAALSTAGINCLLVGSTVLIYATSAAIEYIRVDDGGDGTLLKATAIDVEEASDLPPIALIGHVVRVSPTGKDAYYLRAEGPSTHTLSSQGIGQVTWRECAAIDSLPAVPFCIGVVHAHTLYVGTTGADLVAALPGGHGITVPPITGRVAGDEDSAPRPHFIGRVVTYMGVFQDRLLIGSENVLNASRVGDYFGFYRASALTVPDDDPVEVYANGSEDDVLRYGAFFDRSLVLFGDKQQYALSGKVPLTPSTSIMAQSSAHRDATGVRPLALGDLLFYAKQDDTAARVYQIAVGAVDDTASSQEITQQLDAYIRGTVEHFVGVSMPAALVVKATGSNDLLVYRFIDNGQERVLDSWSRWRFHPDLGQVAGLGVVGDRLRILFARQFGDTLKLSVDEAQLTVGQVRAPYLDSRTAGDAARETHASMQMAFGDVGVAERNWQGTTTLSGTAQLLADVGGSAADTVMGYPMESSVTLTSPFPRDSNDSPIVTGRTTVSALVVAYARSGGMLVDVVSAYGTQTVVDFNGITIGQSNIGWVVPSNGTQRAVIGREVREYEAVVRSRSWLPLAVTSIDWVGQYFNNTRRV